MAPFFQDPLLRAIGQITCIGGGSVGHQSWLIELADSLQQQRQRVNTNRFLAQRSDPSLETFFSFLKQRRLFLRWEHLVILGCSAGGDVALRSIFKHLQFPHIPILIAMHHRPGFKFMVDFTLANQVRQRPLPATEGRVISGGRVYFLPGDKQTLFQAGTRAFKFSPHLERPRFRPVIDQIFEAAAVAFKTNLTAVVLSGMLDDGAQGTHTVILNGGKVWIQDPSSALFKDMPQAAQREAPLAPIKTPLQIAEGINKLSEKYLSIGPLGLSERN